MMLKNLSNGSLLTLRLGQWVRQTSEDEAFSKAVEEELVRRGVITLIPTGTLIHWGKISDEARYDISEYFRDEVWGIFMSDLSQWQRAHDTNPRRRGRKWVRDGTTE